MELTEEEKNTFIKELLGNLEIEVEVKDTSFYDYESKETRVKVKLIYDDEIISESEDCLAH